MHRLLDIAKKYEALARKMHSDTSKIANWESMLSSTQSTDVVQLIMCLSASPVAQHSPLRPSTDWQNSLWFAAATHAQLVRPCVPNFTQASRMRSIALRAD